MGTKSLSNLFQGIFKVLEFGTPGFVLSPSELPFIHNRGSCGALFVLGP
jgi:hypothetical protein